MFTKRKAYYSWFKMKNMCKMSAFDQGLLPSSVYPGRHWRHSRDKMDQVFPTPSPPLFLHTASHQNWTMGRPGNEATIYVAVKHYSDAYFERTTAFEHRTSVRGGAHMHMCKRVKYSWVYTVRVSPTRNGSTALQRFERGNAIAIRNGIMFDFYLGLLHISLNVQ